MVGWGRIVGGGGWRGGKGGEGRGGEGAKGNFRIRTARYCKGTKKSKFTTLPRKCRVSSAHRFVKKKKTVMLWQSRRQPSLRHPRHPRPASPL